MNFVLIKNIIKRYAAPLLFLVFVVYSFSITNVRLDSLIRGAPMLWDMLKEMTPPNFRFGDVILRLVYETITIGVWGTFFGTIISVPLGFFSAKNTSPNKVVYNLAKSIVTTLRTIPEAVYVLILISALGIGNLPGIITIALNTIGLASKFFSEAIESIDIKPVEAVKSTGSHFFHVIRHSIVPQIIPLFSGYMLFVLDHNIRVTIGIGVIGAGGIGIELFTRMRMFHYDRAFAMIIVILIIVSLIDRLSGYVRKATLNGDFLTKKSRKFDFFIIGAFVVFMLTSVKDVAVQLKTLYEGLPTMVEVISSMVPPNFSEIGKYALLVVETLGMAVAGSVMAVLCSIVIGILAARNIIKFKIVNRIASEFSNFCRAMPDIMFALFFIVAVGLGPFAGVIALTLSSIGFLGKFYAEAIENIDPKPLEAIEATGANKFHVIRHAVVPQVLPLFNSYNLYIVDRNVRESAILGIVGAGGIGFELAMSMRMADYSKMAAIVILIFVLILTVDYISTYLRKKILE